MNTIKKLIDKLDPNTKRYLEKAASLCLNRTHFHVELEHWLQILLQEPSLLRAMLEASHCNMAKMTADLTKALEKLKVGNTTTPAISNSILDVMSEAWLKATVFEAETIDSGLLLLALRDQRLLFQVACNISSEFEKMADVDLVQTYQALKKQQKAASPAGSTQPGSEKALAKFASNLNALAKEGKLDSAIGRDYEITQVVDILARRRQNNAILTGDPGVGKTAIVEGLALKIVEGDVPDFLKECVIYSLDMGALQAGASMKGEFENRLKDLVNELKNLSEPAILFIDEAHTLIGAGGQGGQNDAANLLKPALARGELRSIAATTWAEYKKYFEKDPALSRRFQVVKVEEPTLDQACQMTRGAANALENFHQVQILEEAVTDAVQLSARYIADRKLPDKAISVLDTACARLVSKLSALPPEIYVKSKSLEQKIIEYDRLTKEKKYHDTLKDRHKELKADIQALKTELTDSKDQWQQQKDITEKVIELIKQMDQVSSKEQKSVLSALKPLQKQLKKMQVDHAMVQPFVDGNLIAEVISDWTGIPLKKMMKDDISAIQQLSAQLEQRVIGQSHAMVQIAEKIKQSYAKINKPNQPVGVFLLVGTSGVGKTETALALADLLYGSDQKLTVINLSEFKEAHKVSMLLGSPPGYVGYGEGGVLTEAVRRQPYSLILLDEVEKAHPSVQDVFYQIFDKGVVKDGQGRDINFKNTVIILTSNACSETIETLCSDADTLPEPAGLYKALQSELESVFKPAFLGRVNVIPYYPLTEDNLIKICEAKLTQLKNRLMEQHRIQLEVGDGVYAYIINKCTNTGLGARQIESWLDREVLSSVADLILDDLAKDRARKKMTIKLKSDTLLVE